MSSQNLLALALGFSFGCGGTRHCTDVPNPTFTSTSVTVAGSSAVVSGVFLDVRGDVCGDKSRYVGTIHVLDLVAGTSRGKALPGTDLESADIPGRFAITPDGSAAFAPVIYGAHAGDIVRLDLSTMATRLIAIQGFAREAVLLGDGSGIAFPSDEAPLPVLELPAETLSSIATPGAIHAAIQGVGPLFAVGTTGGVLQIDLPSRTVVRQFATSAATSLALSENGEWLFVSSPATQTITRFALATTAALSVVTGPGLEIAALVSSNEVMAYTGAFSRLPVLPSPPYPYASYFVNLSSQVVTTAPLIVLDPPLALDTQRVLTAEATEGNWQGGAIITDLATGVRTLAGPSQARLSALARLDDGRILAISDTGWGRGHPPAVFDRTVFILNGTTLAEEDAFGLKFPE